MRKRTVLLTGASRGIGQSIYAKLEKDYSIIAPQRSELDLLDNKSIDSFIQKNKQHAIDIIIHNAGINLPQWIEEMTDDNIYNTMQTNLIAPIRITRGFVGTMKQQKWGRIVHISSAFGIVARGKQALYSATKHGINGVTKALALELAQYSILVNSVCPGFTRTDLVIKKNSPEKIALLEKDIPLGRLAEPEEIARLVEFLISENNTYMTGECVVIDGGFVCK